MSIERGLNEQPVANALQDAYQAFRAGSITRAEELYRSVLRMNPDQRDALLGMAAIATKQGEKETAIGHYRHLLEIDPKDSIANAALYSLQGTGNSGNNGEERLRRLAEQDPNSAHLQFTLGNVYAQQGRWGDAQNAYFRALSTDKNNPDYAYNLAVSLDRLGQGKTAVQYYQRALELGRQQARSFNDMEVSARIQTLSSQRSSTY
jgi:tetratricopeptide (TPR) repeat protein